MQSRTERGCLAIADISGYTGYLTGSELDHAHDILADLMGTVVGGIRPVLRLVKLEGDAAFAYAPAGKVDGSALMDVVEGCFFTFQRRLRDIRQATSCECNACLSIPTLNLKFFAHEGEFVRHRIAGHEDLTGTDVIVVHRLLKNTVTETFGLNGYSLFTAACVTAMGVDPAALGMREHSERYDHIGEVRVYIQDLGARWKEAQEHTRVAVTKADADLEFELIMPGPPALVWEYLTSPAKRILYLVGADRVDQISPSGRRGVGTTNHCVHGPGMIVEEILDWRPLEYYTVRAVPFGTIPLDITAELTPVEADTRVTWRIRLPRGRKAKETWEAMREPMAATFQQGAARMAELLAAERASASEDPDLPGPSPAGS